jgi:hypothetical protein
LARVLSVDVGMEGEGVQELLRADMT